MQSIVNRVAFLLSLLVAMTAPQAAQAGAKEEARKHYDRAVELVDDGQLPEAIIEFGRSYDLTKHFSVLYNIGQVYVSLAKPVEAVDAYERYLVGGGKNIPAARRAEVEKEIARQKARIATLVFHILPEGATVRVDGNDIGTTPLAHPLSVGIGEHVVSATCERHEPAEVKVTVAGEDRRTVELTLTAIPEKRAEPEPVLGPPVATEPPSVVLPVAPLASLAEAPSTSTVATPVFSTTQPATPALTEAHTSVRSITRLQVTGLAAGAVGAAGLVAGTVCWAVAKSRHNDAVSYWNSGNSDPKAQSLQGQAQNYANAASVSLIAGGALVAVGAALYVLGNPSAETASPDPHAHLMPAVGPGFAGINAGGTW